jgi:hypothetical protein
MSLADDYVAGAATAALMVHQMLINALVLEGVLKREVVTELFDTTILAAETMQANASQTGNEALISSARGARFH